MTMKKRIFLTNSCMVFLALFVLLLVGGGMLSLFKNELSGWYRSNSRLSDHFETVYDLVPDLFRGSADWEKAAKKLETYDYRLLVRSQDHKTVFENAKHSEEESAETLYDVKKKVGQADCYLIEHTTIIVFRSKVGGISYDCYAVNCPSEASIFGMDRGLFEMFILIFLTVGVIAIVIILLLSQLLTKALIQKILAPVQKLDSAAQRVTEGDLSGKIGYETDDEFKPVCDSFDLMQQHLQEELDRNRAYEKARTEMVSGISHDLRTPLTSIKGYIKGLLDGVANTQEKQKEYLQITYRKSCDMEKLLSKLFYFSKLETGNMPFFMQPVDMRVFLADYIEEKSVELEEKGVRIQENWKAGQSIFCEIDREQMLRVFDNLVENALKYADRKENLLLQIHAFQVQNQRLCIDFSDNGKGMEPKKITHVFDQFYRGDEARNSACDGNGLGLYVCQYIVKKHNGSIRAENHEGFHVIMEFPISRQREG